ncbi:DNA-3-methyladenine glycosylase family protein [Streptomyces sp. NPDC088794]|uniref:DNA-3-methyladenine glycosylase family protein n=1 Tax=Streptomyces sp. NPDC088794 TaxID=3365902 RepID=UPI0037F3ED4F
MSAVSLTPKGPYSLTASTRFLEGFTPAAYNDASDGILRLAFPADDHHTVIGCALRSNEAADHHPPTVHADITLHPAPGHQAPTNQAARAQIARILSLDVDGTDFPAVGQRDPVVAALQAQYPGLRPVLFHSPYEAAAWTIIGNRIRMTQAAAIKARIAHDHGKAVNVAGRQLHAFPTPGVLRTLDHIPGLTDVKVERLHAIAQAALDGHLDAATLRAHDTQQALHDLQQLPGIGPFSAELILVRGVGHPDVFPANEARLHQAITTQYQLDPVTAAAPQKLARIADVWRPYRSWIALLLRTQAEHDPTRPTHSNHRK